MNLEIVIEKLKNDVHIPLREKEIGSFQMRSDGIIMNGKLHLWEEILFIQITNRELLDKLAEEQPLQP